MGLILCIFLIQQINARQEVNVKPNYLGLAKLGLIPTKQTCSHSQSAYDSTGVYAQMQDGSKYLILMSKFGDESCMVKIS